MKKCLLITPLSFYSMHSVIVKEISLRGYTVDLMNDEYPETLMGQFLGNFFNYLVRRLTLIKFDDFFSKEKKHYDLIIIFKGRGVSIELLELFKLHSDRIISYNWDSFGFFKGPIKWLKVVDSYKTFDFVDSAKHNLKRVDLFSEYVVSPLPEKNIDISCVIKNHSHRLVYLDEIHSLLADRYNFKIFIYEKNFLTLIRNLLKHPILIYKWRKHIHFTGLSTDEFFKVISASKFTIDYAHPSQTGITMRCFQAAACGTRVITNNDYVKESISLNGDNYFIHKIGEDAKSLVLYIEKNSLEQPVVTYRSIVNFVDDLLS